MDLKVNGKTFRDMEKAVLHEHIIRQEKHKEKLKTLSAPDIYLWDKPTSHAYVYTLYGHEMYLTYLRYSIMSLRLSDPSAKIIVFAESKIWERAVEELKHLVFEHDIKFVNGDAATYKQVVVCHPALQWHRQVTFVDADLFFVHDKGQVMSKIRWEIQELLNRNNTSFVWAFGRTEEPDISHTFMHKRGRVGTTNPDTYVWDLEEQLDYDVTNMLETEKVWNISYIFSCHPKALATPEYKAWAMYSMFNNNHCDETVWYLWAKKNNWKNYHMSTHFKDLIDISSTKADTKKDLLLFQPMFTDTMTSKTHRRWQTFLTILEIENKYKEFIEHERLQHKQV